MGDAQALYALWLREFKVFLREKSRVVGAIATPLVFLFGFGSAVGSTATLNDPQYAAYGYQRFIFPGIVGMSVLFGTVFFGINIIWDKRLDVLKEVLVAPVSRTTIFFGKVLGGATEAVAQALLLLVLGVVFYHVPVFGAIGSLVFVLLMAILFVSIGLFLGSFFNSYEGFNLIVSFLIFPAFLLSGALNPVEGLPPWLSVLTRVNPATYAVDGLRGMLLGPHAFAYTTDVAVLAAFGVAFVFAGTWAFKRMK